METVIDDTEERARMVRQYAGELFGRLSYNNANKLQERIAAAIREAVAAEQEAFMQELVALSEKPFDVETALAGQSRELSIHNAGQVGFAGAIFALKAAIEARVAPSEGGDANA